ncbi:MAG: hypothetical protein EA379_07030 [Phycisphaerales bacterium]|nr:MAG: hypothetical protein EA379_07030 [Phycisphaerales bacterium]
MSHDEAHRWSRLREIFRGIDGLDPHDAAARAHSLAGGDADLAREALEMLEADRARTAFLSDEDLDWLDTDPEPDGDREDELIGATIGGFTLLRRISSGGMGVVYEAQQERPSRRVALKLLRRDAQTRDSVRRFAFETEVLARLRHPGIAQIYAAGIDRSTDTARPYFAMELVEGETLLESARRRGLGVRERLELFVQVCDAVHEAHVKEVIHRDLKPANICVVEPGPGEAGVGRVKVLDFGVARAVDPSLRMTTMGVGSNALLGTLSYMSPEHITSGGADVDARSDVYALGVILFELLAGKPPHDLRSMSLPQAARTICDHEAPRLRSVAPSLPADLGTIVATALANDPMRRYESAKALAADVLRHLAHRPILAHPPSAFQQACMFARRNSALTALGALALATLVVALVVVSVSRSQALEARAEAHRQYELARDTAGFLLTDIVDDLEALGGAAELRRKLLEDVHRRISTFVHVQSDDVLVQKYHARVLRALANLAQQRGDLDAAHAYISEALPIFERLADGQPRDSMHRMEFAIATVRLGDIEWALGRRNQALRFYKDAFEMEFDLAAADPGSRRFADNLYWSHARLAIAHMHLENNALSEYHHSAAERAARDLMERFPSYAQTLHVNANASLMNAQWARRKSELRVEHELTLAAVEWFQSLLEHNPMHRVYQIGLVTAKRLYADQLYTLGALDDAEAALTSLHRSITSLLKGEPDDPELLRQMRWTLERSGDLHATRGDTALSLSMYEDALSHCLRVCDIVSHPPARIRDRLTAKLDSGRRAAGN